MQTKHALVPIKYARADCEYARADQARLRCL